jgi:hypothetical protein
MPQIVTDPLCPTWIKTAVVVMVAVFAFFVPQEVPLEYYPLNNPSSGRNYIEVKCSANVRGEVKIYLDFGSGLNELNAIAWPVGPGQTAFTYVFPLSDAPLVGMRLDPFTGGGGELRIDEFRIIDDRQKEVRRFGPDDFGDLHQIQAITGNSDGWKIVVPPGADDPSAQVHIGRSIIPEGLNERNAKRCLLSVGYLWGMLWLAMLAIYSALRLWSSFSGAVQSICFLLLISFCFAVAGNRGLLKNTVRYATLAAHLEKAGL